MKRLLILMMVLGFARASSAAKTEEDWRVGVREGGGGFFLSAPDEKFHLSLLGYGQFAANAFLGQYESTVARSDVPASFSLRRARFDLIARVFRKFELLTEVGTPTLRGTTGVGGSDVGIIESRVTGPIYEDALQFRLGKFVIPFSSENARSSRRLDSIERSLLLNSLIAAGYLDTQTGMLFFGRALDGGINYFFGVFNGNGQNLDNPPDDNRFKEFHFKFSFRPVSSFAFGLAYQYGKENTRNFALLDHAFVPFATGQINGRHHGLAFDFDVTERRWSLRSEFLYYSFPELSSVTNRISAIYGANIHLGFFLSGSREEGEGFEWIIRSEWARMVDQSADAPDLVSAIVGWNWWFNPNMRYQFNYIIEAPDQATGLGPYVSASLKHVILNQFQIMF